MEQVLYEILGVLQKMSNDNSSLIGIIQIVLSIITFVATICIPIQIMKFQRYTNILSTYATFEFSYAFQSVINFFYDTCSCDVERIPTEYKKRFDYDVKNKVDIQNRLHYQRRHLNEFFCELEMCRESSLILRHKIRKEWTTNEAWLVKILIYMNKVVDDSPEIFKDIKGIKYEKMPKTRGLSTYLERFYNAMKAQSRSMQV